VEDINANFDAVFRALAAAGISPAGISPPGPSGGGGTGPVSGLSDPVTEAHGGTGKTTYAKGDLLVGLPNHKLDKLAVGADGRALEVVSGTPAWVDPAHAVLSADHTDTTPAAVVRGDIITGQDATPKWKRLAKGIAGYVLRMGANEPEWADPAHNVLSATHGDATAAAAVRGDILTAQGVSPKWTRLAKGTTNQVLKGGASEPTWGDESDPKFALTKRYGFVDNAETTIALAAVGDGTYRFTLGSVGATWRYFRNGVLCTITGSKTVLLAGTNPPTEGAHHIYFDSEDGTLVDGGAWTLLDTKVPIAHISFKGALTPTFWMSDERHTCLIDRRYHYAEHVTEGTKLAAGGSITGYTKNGTTNNENTFGIASVVLIDEDLTFNLADLADPNANESAYVLMYRTDASTWTWAASTRPFRWTAAGYIQYDLNGTMTEGIANRFYNYYLLFSNIDGAARFVLIPGRGQFSTLAGAQAEIVEDFTFTGLDIDEFVIAYRFTWHTSAALGTDGKVELEDDPEPIDISGSHIAVGGGATDHNTLANLQGGAEAEFYHLSAAEAVVIAALPAASVSLQAATPGTAQTGHANITGTFIASDLEVGTSLFTGEFHVDNFGEGVIFQTAPSPGDGSNGYGVYIQATLNPDTSGAHNLLAALYLPAPGFGGGAATVTDAATLVIAGPPAGGTNPYSLLVQSGHAKFGGNITMPAESWVGPSNVAGIYFKGGNVGIGTTTPTLLLSVPGNAATEGLPAVSGTTPVGHALFGGGYNANTIYVGTMNASPYAGWVQVAHNVTLAAYYPLLLNPNGGNVGIGTTTPTSRLSVLGTRYDPSLTYTDPATAEITAGAGGVALTMSYYGGGSNSFWLQTRNNAASGYSYPLVFNPLGGNVGIGTTDPIQLLNVGATDRASNTFIRIGTDGSHSQGVEFHRQGSQSATLGMVANKLQYSINPAAFDDSSLNAAAKFTIDTSGNVGIGTTSPLGSFSLGNINAPASYTRNGVDQFVLQAQYDPSVENNYARYADVVSLGDKNGTNGGGAIRFLSNPPSSYVASEWMRITQTGNVGIGTTAPGTRLSVAPNAGFNAPTLGVASGALSVLGGTELYGLYGGVADTGYAWLQAMRNDAATAYALLLNPSGGNVGIGTIEPAYRLDIQKSVTGGDPFDGLFVCNLAPYVSGTNGFGPARILLGRGYGNPTGYIESGAGDTNSGDGYLAFGNRLNNVLTEAFRIQIASSNVGIGTTAPASKLAINGGVHVGGDSDAGDNNLLVDGTGTITGAFGCNTKTAQTAYASAGALAAYGTGAFGLDSDVNMAALHALVVAIRAALVANGIMS
jgi:hypothetical protein